MAASVVPPQQLVKVDYVSAMTHESTAGAKETLDDEIARTRELARRHERLTHQRGELGKHMAAVRDQLATAERRLTKEQQDVAKLEQGAFAGFMANLAGGKQQQLGRERWEAAAAHQQVQGERARLDQLGADAQRMDAELARLAGAPQQHEEALRRKEEELRQSGDPRTRELMQVHQRLTNGDIGLREHSQALEAARTAAQPLAAVRQQLGGAATWSTVDMIVGTGWAKFDHLESADQLVWHAQRGLDLLTRELSDVGVNARPQLPRVEANWFADVLFDNIISDALKHKKINEAIRQIDSVGQWLNDTLRWLQGRCGEFDREVRQLRDRREQLLGGA